MTADEQIDPSECDRRSDATLVIPPSTHASEPDREAFEGLLTGDINNNGDLESLALEVQRAITR